MSAGRPVPLDIEPLIAAVLRTGVRLSSVCLGAGLVLALTGGAPHVAAALLTTGLIVLFATPAARVIASCLAYVIERDWTFAALTAIVLLELGAGLFAALHGRQL